MPSTRAIGNRLTVSSIPPTTSRSSQDASVLHSVKACVLNLMDHEPTTNREDECAIVEHAFSEDYVHVEIPERNGKTVAVIGAGPAGLVAANQLNHKGYKVTVFEARENAGGLLRYGIPNFKLNKSIIDRRLRLRRGGHRVQIQSAD